DPLASGLAPRAGVSVLERAHYADQRDDEWRYSTQPFVQSEVVSDPYLRVFVPVSPRRAPAALGAACPGVSLTEDDDPAREAAPLRRRPSCGCPAYADAPLRIGFRVRGAVVGRTSRSDGRQLETVRFGEMRQREA